MMAAFFATVKTMQIVTQKFGNQHHKQNIANAVRHALWCMLMVDYCSLFTRNYQKAVSFTKTITDAHEEIFPNDDLAKQMDIHNNWMGILWVQAVEKSTANQKIDFLMQKAKNAIQIQSLADFPTENELVYIE